MIFGVHTFYRSKFRAMKYLQVELGEICEKALEMRKFVYLSRVFKTQQRNTCRIVPNIRLAV